MAWDRQKTSQMWQWSVWEMTIKIWKRKMDYKERAHSQVLKIMDRRQRQEKQERVRASSKLYKKDDKR